MVLPRTGRRKFMPLTSVCQKETIMPPFLPLKRKVIQRARQEEQTLAEICRSNKINLAAFPSLHFIRLSMDDILALDSDDSDKLMQILQVNSVDPFGWSGRGDFPLILNKVFQVYRIEKKDLKQIAIFAKVRALHWACRRFDACGSCGRALHVPSRLDTSCPCEGFSYCSPSCRRRHYAIHGPFCTRAHYYPASRVQLYNMHQAVLESPWHGMPNDFFEETQTLLQCAGKSIEAQMDVFRRLPCDLAHRYGYAAFTEIMMLLLQQCCLVGHLDEERYWQQIIKFVKHERRDPKYKSNALAFLDSRPLIYKLALTTASGGYQAFFFGTEVIYHLSRASCFPLPMAVALIYANNEEAHPLHQSVPFNVYRQISGLLSFGRCSRECAALSWIQLSERSHRDCDSYQILTRDVSITALDSYKQTHIPRGSLDVERAISGNQTRTLVRIKSHLSELVTRAQVAMRKEHKAVALYGGRLISLRLLKLPGTTHERGEAHLDTSSYLFLESCLVVAKIQYEFVEWANGLLAQIDNALVNT